MAKLFGLDCLVKDNYCSIGNEMIIWRSSEIIHSCPFTIIAETKLVSGYDFSPYYKTYMSNDNHWLFNVTHDDTFICVCDMRRKILYKTSEGPYIYFRMENPTNKTANLDSMDFNCVKKEIVQENSVIDLMLAEQDFARKKAFDERAYLNYEICLSFNAQLQVLSTFNDRIFRIKNLLGEEAIVYARDNNIFIPQCKKVDIIYVLPISTACYEDIPVSFSLSNKTYDGFLTSERVLKLTSSVGTYLCKSY